MVTLMQITLELRAPDEAPAPNDEGRDEDADAKVMASGAIDGAIMAVNEIVGKRGYELVRVVAD